MEIKQRTPDGLDLVSLGEVMLRLDPGAERIHTARTFGVNEGGGEYNVARGLRRCFGMRTAHVTALVDNAVGRLIEDLMLAGGTDLSHLIWQSFDGLGHDARCGLNFTERGFGVRAALGCSDRGHTAASQMAPGDVDWDNLFSEHGVRWFHTGGIYAALSESAAALCEEALQSAQRHGVRTSYDLNYRPSLWKARGGQTEAQHCNQRMAPFVDVMIGNEEDFTAALGFEAFDSTEGKLDLNTFSKMITRVVETYPNFKVVATTLRHATTATLNDWGALAWHEGALHHAQDRPALEILDRVGGGDSFASGLIYGFLQEKGAAWAVECGAAHGALAMTTAGDTSQATLADVERVMAGGGARVDR